MPMVFVHQVKGGVPRVFEFRSMYPLVFSGGISNESGEQLLDFL